MPDGAAAGGHGVGRVAAAWRSGQGISIAEATDKIYSRVPLSEVNFFSIVIQIQAKAGGNLGEVLSSLSKVIRERKKLRDKVDAMSMEAKSSAIIIGALPFLVGVLVFMGSPDYISLLWTTKAGQVGLGICLAVMNSAFYLALDRLPMSLVAAIEFVGTIGIALYGLRSRRNYAALAVAVAALGLGIARAPGAVAWRDGLRFPLDAVLVAGVSTASLVASHLGVPDVPSELWWRMEHLGAFGMGVAIALILVRDPWRRAIAASPLAIAATYTISMQTAGVIGSCLVGAIALWWLLRLGRLLHPLLAGSKASEPHHPSP